MPNITSKVKIINTIWQINSGCRVYHRHFVRSLPCFAPIRVLEPSQLSANQNSFALAYNWKVASKYFLCALFILVNAPATMHSSELSQSSVPRGMNACKLHKLNTRSPLHHQQCILFLENRHTTQGVGTNGEDSCAMCLELTQTGEIRQWWNKLCIHQMGKKWFEIVIVK